MSFENYIQKHSLFQMYVGSTKAHRLSIILLNPYLESSKYRTERKRKKVCVGILSSATDI